MASCAADHSTDLQFYVNCCRQLVVRKSAKSKQLSTSLGVESETNEDNNAVNRKAIARDTITDSALDRLHPKTSSDGTRHDWLTRISMATMIDDD